VLAALAFEHGDRIAIDRHTSRCSILASKRPLGSMEAGIDLWTSAEDMGSC